MVYCLLFSWRRCLRWVFIVNSVAYFVRFFAFYDLVLYCFFKVCLVFGVFVLYFDLCFGTCDCGCWCCCLLLKCWCVWCFGLLVCLCWLFGFSSFMMLDVWWVYGCLGLICGVLCLVWFYTCLLLFCCSLGIVWCLVEWIVITLWIVGYNELIVLVWCLFNSVVCFYILLIWLSCCLLYLLFASGGWFVCEFCVCLLVIVAALFCLFGWCW